ncbi:DNA repair protein XRCC2 [Atheta coriaria]|uniref:DNA repair protein XRCC2 n=1 Tax=Dalotia coriaria TaxID=877792 RepID=UPI0031F3EAA1
MSKTTSNVKTETGYQLFNRIHLRPRLDKLHSAIFTNGPAPNKVIQITGAPNTGKSMLIAELIVNTILPKKLSEEFKECSAVLINTDHQISIIQIIQIAERKLSMLNIPTELHQGLVRTSLKKLTILNCYCIRQLEVTILNLEHILSQNIDIALLAIDSLSAHYWYERYAATFKNENELYSVNKHCVHLLKSLKAIIEDRHIVTVFSKYETDSSLTTMIDYTVTLKKVDFKNEENKNQFLLECYDHEKQTKVVKCYEMETLMLFQIA